VTFVCVFAVIFQEGNAVPLYHYMLCNSGHMPVLHALVLSLSLSDILKKENAVVKHLVVNNLFIGRKKCQ